MRILKNSNKTIFVITTGGSAPGCPKIILNKNKALLRDDYRGELTIAKQALHMLAQM